MLLNNLLNLGLNVARDVTRRDRLEQLSLLAREMLTEVRLPLGDLVDGDRVEQTVDTGVDDRDLNLHRQGLVLALLEELRQARTTGEQETRRGVEVGTELRERGDFTVLREVELERTGELLHDLRLCGGTDTGDGETDVDGGADTAEEELGLQEYLAVSDGNDLNGSSVNVNLLG